MGNIVSLSAIHQCMYVLWYSIVYKIFNNFLCLNLIYNIPNVYTTPVVYVLTHTHKKSSSFGLGSVKVNNI